MQTTTHAGKKKMGRPLSGRPHKTTLSMAINVGDSEALRAAHRESDIESIYEMNVPRSYPILMTDYREKVASMHKQIEPYKNIITFGRQANFSYNNSDIIIKETLNHPMFLSNT